MADNKINVGGRLHSIATGNVLAGANEILDDSKNKKQSDINTETYSLVNDVNERLSGLNPDQQSALSVAAKATNNETKLGYYVCDTEGNVAAKVISNATGYVLSPGGSMKVKMTNANTVNNATLNINSTGAKALYYDGERASAKNSWEAGETVEVYYDGTSFYANSVAGGSGSGDGAFDVSVKYPTSGVEGGNTYTLEGALAVLNSNLSASKKKGGMSIKFVQSSDNKYVQYRYMGTSTANADFMNIYNWQGVDNEPTAGSDNLVKSGGVYKNIYGSSKLSTNYEYEGVENKYYLGVKDGGKYVLQITSESAFSINVYHNNILLAVVDNSDWQMLVIPAGSSNSLVFNHGTDENLSIHIELRKIENELEFNYDYFRLHQKLSQNKNDINLLKGYISNDYPYVKAYPYLSESQKSALSIIEYFDLTFDSMFDGDTFAIIGIGIIENTVILRVYNTTKSLSLCSISLATSNFGSEFKIFEFNSTLCRGTIIINPSAFSNAGYINENIEIVPKFSDINSFKAFNVSVANEKMLVQAIKSLKLTKKDGLINGANIYTLSAFGWTSASSLYGFIRISLDGAGILNGTFDASTSKPTGIKSYKYENDNYIVEFTVDWNYQPTMWYNTTSSGLIIRNIASIIADNEKDYIVTPCRNLFKIDAILNGKYLKDTGVDVLDNEGYFTTKFIKVEPGKIYKTNIPITRVVYCKSTSTWSRTVTPAGSPYVIQPASGEMYIRFSSNKKGMIETCVLHEVDDANMPVRQSLLNMYTTAIKESDYQMLNTNAELQSVFTIGSKSAKNSQLNLSITNAEKLIAIPIVGNYDGKITNLNFECVCDADFVLTIGVGIIDQRDWGLLSRTATVNVTNGLNNIATDIQIKQGEKLFVIANSASSAANAKLYLSSAGIHQESAEGEITMGYASGCIQIEYVINGKLYTSGNFATVEEFGNLAKEVSNNTAAVKNLTLNNIFIASPNDTFFKLNVSNEGVLSTEAVPVAGKFLIMGNSYDVSKYIPGLWWGDFSMAASRKENDWKHLLLNKLRNEDNLIYNFRKQSLSAWETNWDNYDYSNLDDALNDTYSLIIMRIGENNTDTDWTRVQSRMNQLLTYITNAVGSSIPIILSGALKVRTEQNAYFQAAAANFDNVTYVDLTEAGKIDPFNAGLDYRVFGDDGIWHTISESSMAGAVSYHPNDNVFAKVVELLYPVVVDKLGI